MLALRFSALIACALIFLAGSRLRAQIEPHGLEDIPYADDTILRSWIPQDGLPDVDISGITQMPDGYLWLATFHGLARFDGVRFTSVSESSEPNPIDVSSVLTARDGTLWAMFGEGGLARWWKGQLETVIPSPSSRKRALTSLAEDAEGGIWAGLPQGSAVLRWKAGKIDRFHFENGSDPISLCSAAGVIWFSSYKHCGFFNGREFQLQPLGDNACGNLAAARAGGGWTIAGQKLFRFRENGKTETVADVSWLGNATLDASLYEDHGGSLWIGTLGVGLIRFRDGKFERVPTSFPLINCLYEDRNGNLWVGTRGGGLDCVSRRQIFTHAAPTSRSPNSTEPRDILAGAVAVDNKGIVWMAQGGSLVRATDATNREFALAPGWTGPNGIFTMRATSTGELWLGGDRPHALREWKDGHFLTEVPLPGTVASFLLGDAPNQIWAALKPNPGVYEYRGKDFTLLPESAGISNPVALALDPQKRLWVGTLDGRVYYREGKGFVEAPMPDPLPGDMVSFLVPDGRNTVWIGCVASGLYRWHAGRIDKLPAEAGLPMREPRVLQIDTKGNFWFGTLLGLFRISRAELEAVLDGRQSTVQAVTFGPKNGMPAAARFHYGFLPSSIRTPDGHLWFGTTFGGMEILPEDMISNAAPPSVLIEAVLARDKSVPFPLPGSAPLVFPPRPSPIQIRYTLPELGALAQVRFRYRLLGLGDDAWSSSDPQRIATFSNLPPGNYTFEVAATNPCALSPPKTASLSFTVRTAWWETLWFRFICALAGAFAVALLVNIIVRRRTQARILRLEQENALDRERARIARDMHDDLGASLTQIMLMSEAAATEHSLPDLDDIAEASRTISTTLDEIVWATNPRNDTLERLISYIAEFSEEYLELTEIQLRLKLPAEIPDHPVPAEKRHHVLLVVKEGLNNIVKYSSATHVQIRATLEQGLLRVVIADNGKGFDSATVLSTSNGLLNMRHRMEAIGGKAEIESEPDHGTTITLSVKV